MMRLFQLWTDAMVLGMVLVQTPLYHCDHAFPEGHDFRTQLMHSPCLTRSHGFKDEAEVARQLLQRMHTSILNHLCFQVQDRTSKTRSRYDCEAPRACKLSLLRCAYLVTL